MRIPTDSFGSTSRKTCRQGRISDLVPACRDQRLLGGHILAPEKDARGIVTGFQGDAGFYATVQAQPDKTDGLFQRALIDCVRIHRHLLLLGMPIE